MCTLTSGISSPFFTLCENWQNKVLYLFTSILSYDYRETLYVFLPQGKVARTETLCDLRVRSFGYVIVYWCPVLFSTTSGFGPFSSQNLTYPQTTKLTKETRSNQFCPRRTYKETSNSVYEGCHFRTKNSVGYKIQTYLSNVQPYVPGVTRWLPHRPHRLHSQSFQKTRDVVSRSRRRTGVPGDFRLHRCNCCAWHGLSVGFPTGVDDFRISVGIVKPWETYSIFVYGDVRLLRVLRVEGHLIVSGRVNVSTCASEDRP